MKIRKIFIVADSFIDYVEKNEVHYLLFDLF